MKKLILSYVYFIPDIESRTTIFNKPAQPAAALLGGVIRIKAGQNSFDPAYFFDLKKVTKADFTAQVLQLNDTKWVVEVIEQLPAGTNATNFYTQKMVKLKVVDIASSAVPTIPGLTDTYGMPWVNKKFYVESYTDSCIQPVISYCGVAFFYRLPKRSVSGI